MQMLKLNALIDVPWKNGGGITRNIAKGLHEGKIAWTISRADVAEAGPFSDFSGMMRVLTVVSGGAMILDTPTTPLTAALFSPVRFDGALKVFSRLEDGPITDLNLMFNPSVCDGDVVVHKGPCGLKVMCPPQGVLAFHGLAGEPCVDGVAICPADTAFVTQSNAALQLKEGEALLELRLSYLSQSEAIKLCIAD